MQDQILVSNHEKVMSNDFYLSDDWIDEVGKEQMQHARELQEEGKLYEAYIVGAMNYAVYTQMDASQVFINRDGDVVLHCESQIIDNEHSHREEYTY